jgi:hypothetical protein
VNQPGRVPFLLHEGTSEHSLGLVLVVSAAFVGGSAGEA